MTALPSQPVARSWLDCFLGARMYSFARTPLIVLAALLAVVACAPLRTAPYEQSTTVVFLVRHAEKMSTRQDPALSEAGERRALQLASLLRDAGIETIYTTDYRRTRDTAAPLAAQLGLTPLIYDGHQLGTLADHLKKAAGRYLVVGHSDTTPELVGLLGGDAGAPIDEKVEYDRLYVVSIAPGEEVDTILLRYGDTSSL